MKLAAVVVWYNPEIDDVSNIDSYEDEVDLIIVVDNSMQKNKKAVEALEKRQKVLYFYMNENIGLAKALNIGCTKAVSEECTHVLTLDQDAYFEAGSVLNMRKYIEDTNCSAIGPRVRTMIYKNGEKKLNNEIKTGQENEWIITAGMLLNLLDWDYVGRFDGKLFIEFIDVDYCLKLVINNKKIGICDTALLNIQQGNAKENHIFGKKVYSNNGSPIRTYYLFRNGFYLKRKYGREYSDYINAHYWRYIVKVILFENNKICKLKNAIKGYVDSKDL